VVGGLLLGLFWLLVGLALAERRMTTCPTFSASDGRGAASSRAGNDGILQRSPGAQIANGRAGPRPSLGQTAWACFAAAGRSALSCRAYIQSAAACALAAVKIARLARFTKGDGTKKCWIEMTGSLRQASRTKAGARFRLSVLRCWLMEDGTGSCETPPCRLAMARRDPVKRL